MDSKTRAYNMKFPIKESMPELDLAIDASLKAGQAVMKIYQTDFKSNIKSDNSPITKADLISNSIIKKILEKSGHYILSEEDSDNISRLDNQTLWIIDPLDGTKDFIEKTGEFTIMIALVQNNKPVIGVINWPSGDNLFIAQKGKGAFKLSEKIWKKISVSSVSNVKSSRVVRSRHHLSNKEKALSEKMKISKFTGIGSSLKVCKISSGEADVYFTFTNKMSEWDSAASNCIVTEAGGKMTDMKGRNLTYNNKDTKHQDGILVTNGILHEKIKLNF